MEFAQQYQKWTALDTNAVFIADSLPGGSEVIRQIRSQSFDLPILSVGGLLFADVVELAGEQADNITYIDPYYRVQTQAMEYFNNLYGKNTPNPPAC